MPDLVAPIIPQPDTSALQYVAKGLSGMMANRRYQQQYELAYQKMAQDAALDQQKFDLAREQVANQYEVQQAQITNLNAEAYEHSAQANYIQEYKGRELKQKKESLAALGDMSKEIAGIKNWGTSDADNALANIYTNYADKGVFELPGGRAIQNSAELKQRTAARNLAGANVVLATRYNSTIRQRGLPPDAMDNLEYDDQTKRFVPNDVWDVNDSGAPFLTVGTALDPTTQKPVMSVVPPSKAKAEIEASGKGMFAKGAGSLGYRFITLKPDEARTMLQMKQKIDNFNAGAGVPPIDAVQGVVADQQAATGDTVKVMHPDGQTVGLIPRANLQKALERGYTEVQ